MVNFLPKGTTNSFFENKVDTLSEKEKARMTEAAMREKTFAEDGMRRRVREEAEALRKRIEEADYLKIKKNTTGNKRPELDA
jgi:hypothetical protein